MLTSKDLLSRAHISRATLNNYINLGLLPKPVVKRPDGEDTRARRMGFFPETVLSTITKIETMKREGLRMDAIVDKMRPGKTSPQEFARASSTPASPTAKEPAEQPKPAEVKPVKAEAPAPASATTRDAKDVTWRPPEPVKDHFTPRLTQVAVMIAQLDQVDRINAELPHNECFQLANQVWGTANLIARRFDAILAPYGRNSLVGYFLPAENRHHVMTAVNCARALQVAVQGISSEWRNRKGWTNDLRLNVGIDEGHERFGAIRSGERAIYAVFGETMDRAIALATVSHGGALWVTKNSMGAIDDEDRKRLGFGIRHREENGHDFTVQSTYARLNDLWDPSGLSPEVARAGSVTVTEIFDVVEG